MTLRTPKFRLSFPYLAEQSKNRETQEPDGYGCQAIIKKSDITPEFKKRFKEAVKGVLVAKFGDEVPGKIKATMKANPLYPMRDGDDKSEFETWRDEYAGSYVATLKGGRYAPGCLVKKFGEKALSKEDIIAEFYAGCYCVATLKPYAWGPVKGKRGASIGLQNIIKVAEGEPLGVVKNKAADDFEDLLDGDVDDDEGIEDGDFDEDGDEGW
jgi:hypothetical protein